MQLFARTNRGFLSRWWWTVDRNFVTCVIALFACGFVMAFAASPAVAQHIGKPIYYFANKQLLFLVFALLVFLAISMIDTRFILPLAVLIFVGAFLATLATLFFGVTAKGASRWLLFGSLSLQPSEILKPAFIVVSAWLFARDRAKFDSRGVFYALSLLVAVCVILAMQPDIGQMTLLALVWMCVYFLAGGSMRLLAMLTMAAVLVGLYLYETKPHVASRIDRFIDPSSGDTYQVDRAMDAIKSGGIVGVGVGDGRIKSFLPDAHSDYVFAVAAEEGGLIIGGLIIFCFGFLVWRALWALREERDHWVQLSAAGLTCLFGLQAVINLAVNLNLMPSKGMTLPFVSYGGSSLLGSALTMGMLAALLRRRINGPAPLQSPRAQPMAAVSGGGAL